MKREYKEKPLAPGLFQIKNHSNGKLFLGSSLILDGPINAPKFMLSVGSHRNAALQADFKKFGANVFSFDILDTVKIKDVAGFSLEAELQVLEEIWLDELQPIVGGGYNPNRKIRQA